MFRSRSKVQRDHHDYLHGNHGHHDQKLTTGDNSFRTLDAVKEAQPFEEATNQGYQPRTLYLSQDGDGKYDIYGNRIMVPDMLNPLRHRDERPLDTIRGFEFQKLPTGPNEPEPVMPQLETYLGWNFHEDFPHASYNGGSPAPQPLRGNYPAHQYSIPSNTYRPASADVGSLDKKKKKKKGLFGRGK